MLNNPWFVGIVGGVISSLIASGILAVFAVNEIGDYSLDMDLEGCWSLVLRLLGFTLIASFWGLLVWELFASSIKGVDSGFELGVTVFVIFLMWLTPVVWGFGMLFIKWEDWR